MKIIQIMPAPQNLCAYFAEEKIEEGTQYSYRPIACLALVDQDGESVVRPMLETEGGPIIFADDSPDYAYLDYPEEIETPLERIKQLIPAPAGLMAHYVKDIEEYPGQVTGNEGTRIAPVVCYALVESKDAHGVNQQEIRAMIGGSSGEAVFADESEDFVFVELERPYTEEAKQHGGHNGEVAQEFEAKYQEAVHRSGRAAELETSGKALAGASMPYFESEQIRLGGRMSRGADVIRINLDGKALIEEIMPYIFDLIKENENG